MRLSVVFSKPLSTAYTIIPSLVVIPFTSPSSYSYCSFFFTYWVTLSPLVSLYTNSAFILSTISLYLKGYKEDIIKSEIDSSFYYRALLK